MKALVQRVRDELGAAGCIAALLLVGVAVFHIAVLQPMQDRRAALSTELSRQLRMASDAAPAIAAGRQVDAFYRTLQRAEGMPDWLAKLYAIGQASGLGLQSATYRSHPGAGRLERYEVMLPISGSYAQIREFVARALAEIPVASLDRLALRRAQTTEGTVDAEVQLTLYTVRQ
jgi:Tfp pilus assembly protein PilO